MPEGYVAIHKGVHMVSCMGVCACVCSRKKREAVMWCTWHKNRGSGKKHEAGVHARRQYAAPARVPAQRHAQQCHVEWKEKCALCLAASTTGMNPKEQKKEK